MDKNQRKKENRFTSVKEIIANIFPNEIQNTENKEPYLLGEYFASETLIKIKL